jgi:hypothetical protein
MLECKIYHTFFQTKVSWKYLTLVNLLIRSVNKTSKKLSTDLEEFTNVLYSIKRKWKMPTCNWLISEAIS